MTPNRRIALNVAATYARSLYKLALGLVTARWLLLALGQVDYGLLGVVGGLVAFVTMINRLLSGAVSRYYAYSIGAAKKKKGKEAAREGLLECRRWFSAAVSVHTTIPLLLVAIGWPVGEYAVSHWLVIPPERLAASLWVWRFTCISSLTAMMNVPFRAMYTAKQEIAELTIYSVAETTLTAFLLYYMVSHPGVWLAKYAFWHCLLAVTPRVLIMLRAVWVYPECRLRRDCLWRWRDIKELAFYAFWNAFAEIGRIVRSQGLAILVNRCFGLAANAAIAIANRLAARANTFSASIVSSFHPAIVAAYSAGKKERMMSLAFRVDKLAGSLVAIVSVPLLIEVNEVMRLWLKKPPQDSPALCACALVMMFMNESTMGQPIVVAATGKVALNRFLQGVSSMMALPVACLFVAGGCGLMSVVYGRLISSAGTMSIRLWSARRLTGMSVVRWAQTVFVPIVISMLLAASAGLPSRLLLAPSFWRVCITTACCEAVLLPLVWFAVLEVEERQYVREKFAKAWRKYGWEGH